MIFMFKTKIRNFLVFVTGLIIPADAVLLTNAFLPDTCVLLQAEIQTLIKTAVLDLATKSQNKTSMETSEKLSTAETESKFWKEHNFETHLSTVTLFIEQEPFLHVPMNLDVNFCCVRQENFTQLGGKNIKEEVFKENGDTFQNSPIHLLFYEKISSTDLEGKHTKISSMSLCQIKGNPEFHLISGAYDIKLILLLKEFTAQFVTKEQYQQLLFILGQNQNKTSIFAGTEQTFKEVLMLFDKFHTGTKENFQDMLHDLQFPFVYNENKSLAENRHDFKDFFSCLTNIRCAVVEGLHCCEAACRTLQGYQLGAPIPLHYDNTIDVPFTSTLFKPISTFVHYCEDDNRVIKEEDLQHFRDISAKLADQKELIVLQTWHNFFNNVLDEMDKTYRIAKR